MFADQQIEFRLQLLLLVYSVITMVVIECLLFFSWLFNVLDMDVTKVNAPIFIEKYFWYILFIRPTVFNLVYISNAHLFFMLDVSQLEFLAMTVAFEMILSDLKHSNVSVLKIILYT